MFFDVHAKSTELLEKLANSIYDRDPLKPNPLFFSLKEIHIVEHWLIDAINDHEKSTFSNNLGVGGDSIFNEADLLTWDDMSVKKPDSL